MYIKVLEAKVPKIFFLFATIFWSVNIFSLNKVLFLIPISLFLGALTLAPLVFRRFVLSELRDFDKRPTGLGNLGHAGLSLLISLILTAISPILVLWFAFIEPIAERYSESIEEEHKVTKALKKDRR